MNGIGGISLRSRTRRIYLMLCPPSYDTAKTLRYPLIVSVFLQWDYGVWHLIWPLTIECRVGVFVHLGCRSDSASPIESRRYLRGVPASGTARVDSLVNTHRDVAAKVTATPASFFTVAGGWQGVRVDACLNSKKTRRFLRVDLEVLCE